jgi:chromosome segregation ATPase
MSGRQEDGGGAGHPEEEEASSELSLENDAGEEGDDAEETPTLPPGHRLFKRLQEDLKRQLSTVADNLEVETRDKQAMKNKLAAEREQIGVELYAIQQQLAKIQTRLTEANEERTAAEASRLEHEAKLKLERIGLDQARHDLVERTKEYESQRGELDKLNDTVLRLEQYNQEKLNEIASIRRQTYKSEQSACETEIVKQDQDLYIDRLTQQVQDITSQLTIIETQILAQRGETKTARDALLQASLEMEKINFERNHLLQDWNSAIIGVKRRSMTLADIQAAALKQEEEIRALQNEHVGLKQQIGEQHEQNERNTILMNKITARIQYLNGKIKAAGDERKAMQKDLDQLSSLIEKKDQTISRLLIERNAAKSEYNLSLKGANQISNQIHDLEDKIINHLTEQSNLKRDVVAVQHMIEQIRDQIVSKDRELSSLQNEVVRLRIDKLNISAQSEKLERGLKQIVDELQAKDNLITQYEMQINHNNRNIEKRQSEVDRLNRQYDQFTSAQNGEEYGPLERKIRQIQSRIAQSDQVSAEDQATWLKKQTELVSLAHACEDLEKLNTTQQAHISVLSRKRDRVRIQLEATEREIAKVQIQIRLLQREMSRLGEQLSESVGHGNVLVEGNVNYEAEILENLRKKEEEAAAMETQIEDLARKREGLAEELMETEKQIMLWEKQLQMAREMREALDPNYGVSELKTMKKEVTRMELRLKQIMKQQQIIVQEMEFSLMRRETIANQGKVQQRLNKDRTRADVAKGITELRREVKRLHGEIEKCDEGMKQNADAQHELGAEIERFHDIARETRNKRSELENQLRTEEKTKVTAQGRLERLQAKNRLFSAQKTILKSVEGFDAAYANVNNQEQQLGGLIDVLTNDFPHLSDNLQSIKDRILS